MTLEKFGDKSIIVTEIRMHGGLASPEMVLEVSTPLTNSNGVVLTPRNLAAPLKVIGPKLIQSS